MKHLQLSVLFLISFAQLSQAQTQNGPTLQAQLLAAEQDKKFALQEIQNATQQDAAQFDICKIAQYRGIIKNAQWFIDHYQQLQLIEKNYLEAESKTRAKLERLRTETIELLPTKGQTATVTVSFQQMIDYFTTFNLRYKKTPPEKRDLLMKIQNDPLMNPPLNVGHTQIIDGLKLIAERINASLKEAREYYTLNVTESGPEVDMQLTQIDDQTKKPIFSMSLIHQNQNNLGSNGPLNSQSIWTFIIQKERLEIDQQPVDALVRYFRMQQESEGLSCGTTPEVQPFYTPHSWVYLSIQNLKRLSAEAKKNPQSSAVKREEFGAFKSVPTAVNYWYKIDHAAKRITLIDSFSVLIHARVINEIGSEIEFKLNTTEPSISYLDQFRNRIELLKDHWFVNGERRTY